MVEMGRDGVDSDPFSCGKNLRAWEGSTLLNLSLPKMYVINLITKVAPLGDGNQRKMIRLYKYHSQGR